ncbi:DUF4336 domain-containing protein [Myxococcota bacterium]
MASIPSPSRLKEHRRAVWLKESWLRFSGAILQTRMTVISVEGGLLLHSPSPAALTPEIRQELEALGTPRYLVAPNEIHNVGLVAFQRAYPTAHTTGCAGHPKRVKAARFDTVLDVSGPPDAAPWTRSGELEFHVIGGNRFLHEIALFHRPSKTLVLTDALEFIDAARHLAPPLPPRWACNLMTRLGFRFSAPCMSPEHHLLCRDPVAVRASLEAIERWSFDSVVIAHGRLLEGQQGRDAVREAFTLTIRAAETRRAPARLLWGVLSKVAGGN